MSEATTAKTVTIDCEKFDLLQIRVLDEIARTIKDALHEAGIKQEKIPELTENITFSIAAIVDGSRVMELEGKPVSPVLTFAADEEGTELVSAEGGSWMHEYAISAVYQLLHEDEED